MHAIGFSNSYPHDSMLSGASCSKWGDSAIYWIYHSDPLDGAIGFPYTYRVDSDLSGG